MDGCCKERVLCRFWAPKSSQHTFFETGPQRVQELYKELCEELFQELCLELYKEPRKLKSSLKPLVKSFIRSL